MPSVGLTIDGDFAAALDAVPAALAILHAVRDNEGTIVDFQWDYINELGAQEILLPASELIGQRLLEKLPEHRDGLFPGYVDVVETGTPMELIEAGYDDTWGTQEVIPRVYDIRATKLRDGFVVWWADVTDRVTARTQLQQGILQRAVSDRVIDRAPIGLALVASDGTFTSVNPAFGRISGHSADQLVGRTFAQITHPDDLDADLTQVQRLAAREIDHYVLDKRYIRRDGEQVWVRLHASGVWDESGDFVTFIAQIVDIDEQKRLIAELERSNDDLKHFAYVASHDLQAPLRIVSTYTELLTESLDPSSLTEEQSDYLTEIASSVHYMQALVSDLLDYSRVTATPPTFEPTSLCAVVTGVVDRMAADLTGAGAEVTLDCSEDVVVPANPTQLAQVMTNLLGNSVKYRHPDRPCRISVSARATSDRVQLRVTDNGIGVPPESAERAFTMFQRLQTEGDGTGIGLALVRKIIQRHGGRVLLDSDGSTGTTIRIDLPAGSTGTEPVLQ